MYALANAPLAEAAFTILGVPFDDTTTHRKGAKLAPSAIREESYNFETYLPDIDVDLADVGICDGGDVTCESLGDLAILKQEVHQVLDEGSFPILMGGEHSLTPRAVSAFSDVRVVCLDAHLDFRSQYMGKDGHACVTRRIAEQLGAERVMVVGVRSMSRGEKNDAEEMGLRFVSMDDLRLGKKDMKWVLGSLGEGPIYLSVDMDVVDPAYAPGVGNPEPGGVTPAEVVRWIDTLADRMVGFDVVETCPPYDNGCTASLAAWFINRVVGSVLKARDSR